MKAGWKTKNLGDLCHVIGGGTPPKDKQEYYSGDIFWATVRDMRSDVITKTECKITKEAVKASSTNIIPGGNVVIATRVGLGKVCLLGQDTAINQDLRGIVPINPKILSVQFLYWWLKNTAVLIVAEGTGATVQGVKLPFVKSLQVPYIPFPEQQRIVTILDEAFDSIAAAKANAEKNLQNGRALFASHLQSVFTPRGEAWVEKKLGTLCSIGDGNYSSKYPKASEFLFSGVPFLTATNLKEGTIKPNEVRYISEEQHSLLKKGHVQTGDLVIVVRGSSTGNSSIVPQIFNGSNLNSQLAYLRPKNEIINRFLFYSFNSPPVQEKVKNEISGAAQPQLPNNKLLDISICYPPIEAQQSIVSNLDILQRETQRLESIYRQKLAALDALKKSLLDQAFTGQL